MTVLVFLAVLLVLVVAHEAGHALVARLARCRVEEFGIGFPPRLLSRRLGETRFSVNAIPLGGFVRITGENGNANDDPRSFSARPRVVRALILLAGVAANLVLAVVLLTIAAGLGTDVPVEGATRTLTDRRVEILEVKDTPTLRAADVRPGDVLLAVSGEMVRDASEAAARVRAASGTALTLTIRRGSSVGEKHLAFGAPKMPDEIVGLSLLDVGTVRVPWREAPREGLRRTARTIAVTGHGLARLAREAVRDARVPEDVAGPVGIAALAGTMARRGLVAVLELTGVLSVNLALVNILPIPALDGGRLAFLLLDALGLRGLRGRPERLAHTIGFALLLALLAAITAGDLQRLAQ